jgi:hypothetical protein
VHPISDEFLRRRSLASRGKIFLSYGRADARSIADQLETDLSKQGFQVWRDVNSLRTAAGWDSQIEAAIRESNVLLALLSPHATRRQGDPGGAVNDSICLDEIAYARFGPSPVPVVPIMVKETNPPLILIRQQWLDLIAGAASPEYPKKLAALVELIEVVIKSGRSPVYDDLEADIFDIDYLIPSQSEHFVGRSWLQNRLVDWITGPSHRKILLITGDPGIGKSTFFADFVSRNPGGHVVAYHACRQSRSDTLQAGKAIRSMASMVSRIWPNSLPLAFELSGQGKPLSLSEALVYPQRAFDEGLLRLLASGPQNEQAVLFIDALDESLMGQGPPVAEVLANSMDLFPQNVRVIATTRAIPHITDLFAGEMASRIEAQSDENQADVRKYIILRTSAPDVALDLRGAVDEIDRRAGGNFLVARLLVNEILETGKIDDGTVGASASLAGVFGRAFARQFPGNESYEPIRKALALISAAFAPLPTNVAVNALGLSSRHALMDLIEPIAPYVVRNDDTLASFHLSFFEWLADQNNRYGVSLIDGHRSALVAFAALVRRLSAGETEHIAEKDYFGRYLLDHLASSSQYLDGEIPLDVLVALNLGMGSRTSTSWPSTVNVPKEFRRYVDFVSRTKNAEAAVFLISVLHEMVLNLYVESGLLKPYNERSTGFDITDGATNGVAVEKAFQIAGAIGAIARGFNENGVFERSPRSAEAIAGFVGSQAYFAGGFSVAGWGSEISQYFADAGDDLNTRLHEVRALLKPATGTETIKPDQGSPNQTR